MDKVDIMPAFSCCNTCADLTTNNSEQWWLFMKDKAISELERTAGDCLSGGCTLLLRGIRKCYPESSPTDELTRSLSKGLSKGTCFDIWSKFNNHMFMTIRLFIVEGKRHPQWPSIEREVCHQDLSSQESLHFVQNQLRTCRENHSTCRERPNAGPNYMPSRVLDIGIGDDSYLDTDFRMPVVLVDNTELVGDRRYTCLTHRWNSDGQNIKTTKNTYEAHKRGIAFKDLDNHYQDTVHILRRLGVRYLWIDSLCIIQDDPVDWERESKSMAKVYGKGVFTLAMHVSPLNTLRQTHNQDHIVSHPSVSPPVYARLQAKHIWEKSEYSSLLERGWIYQERILSPRIVHVSNDEITWECYQRIQCQCREPYTMYGISEYGNPPPKKDHARALNLANRATNPSTIALKRRWRGIVEEYSILNLSFRRDRLPALQGCADQMREHLQEPYFYGMWADDSILDLTWEAVNCHTTARPAELFHVPTWSWAAVPGEVFHPWHPSSGPFAQVHNNLREDQRCDFWVIKGQLIPGLLKLGISTEAKSRIPCRGSHQQAELRVRDDHLQPGAESLSLTGPFYIFQADHELHTPDWTDDKWYKVDFLRAVGDGDIEYCLVLWRYGKGLPGSGVDRETQGGLPIYQRIGLLHFEGFEVQRRKPEKVNMLDWNTAREATIALE